MCLSLSLLFWKGEEFDINFFVCVWSLAVASKKFSGSNVLYLIPKWRKRFSSVGVELWFHEVSMMCCWLRHACRVRVILLFSHAQLGIIGWFPSDTREVKPGESGLEGYRIFECASGLGQVVKSSTRIKKYPQEVRFGDALPPTNLPPDFTNFTSTPPPPTTTQRTSWAFLVGEENGQKMFPPPHRKTRTRKSRSVS